MVKKKVVTVSMKPTHLRPSAAQKTKPITRSPTKPKNTTSKPIKTAQKIQQQTSNEVQKFNYRLLSCQPVQDEAGIFIKLFYDGNFLQQVIVMKSVFEVWSRANREQKRQFITNQLNPNIFGNKANIVYNVCNSIVEYVDAVVANYIAQELARKQAQRRRY